MEWTCFGVTTSLRQTWCRSSCNVDGRPEEGGQQYLARVLRDRKGLRAELGLYQIVDAYKLMCVRKEDYTFDIIRSTFRRYVSAHRIRIRQSEPFGRSKKVKFDFAPLVPARGWCSQRDPSS